MMRLAKSPHGKLDNDSGPVLERGPNETPTPQRKPNKMSYDPKSTQAATRKLDDATLAKLEAKLDARWQLALADPTLPTERLADLYSFCNIVTRERERREHNRQFPNATY